MLVKTRSLERLRNVNMTSVDILERFWRRNGNIYSLISQDNFREVAWADLPSTDYAVISYQWRQNWNSIVTYILDSNSPVRAKWMWIDCKCLDQMDPNKMTTISRSDEIYFHAKEYHLIEIDSLTRGWVLFELASVNVSVRPVIHNSIEGPAARQLIRGHISRTGFAGSNFTVEPDREVVRNNIINRHGSVAIFERLISDILNRIL